MQLGSERGGCPGFKENIGEQGLAGARSQGGIQGRVDADPGQVQPYFYKLLGLILGAPACRTVSAPWRSIGRILWRGKIIQYTGAECRRARLGDNKSITKGRRDGGSIKIRIEIKISRRDGAPG